MASVNFHKIKHITNKSLSKTEAAWRRLTQCVSLSVSFVGCVSLGRGRPHWRAWYTALHFPLASCSSQKAKESDVESSKGLHQGDLCVGLRFTAAAVPMATPALQGFVAVPLLLSLLFLQALLLPPLFVGDLWELVFICFVFFTRAGPLLIVFSSAFIYTLISKESGATATLLP